MAAQEHGPAALPLGMDAIREDFLHQRVEAGGRLVEYQQLHVAGERCDECHLLPVAPGVGGALLGWIELKALQHFVAAHGVDAAA
jgi:hypothetical protein